MDNNKKEIMGPVVPPKRRRGRPRKNQVVNTTEQKKASHKVKEIKKDKLIMKEDDDEIILHLPINLDDISKFKINSSKEKNSSSSAQETNIFTIADISNDSSSDEYDAYNDYKGELITKLKERDEKIKKLEEELSDYKALFKKMRSGTNDRRAVRLDVDLVDIINGKSVVVERTDIACWWCSCNFDNPPCFIPDKCIEGVYYVFGCFCSPNCAAAYNLKIEDYKVWNRYSLIKKLYGVDVPIAPPREALDKFGGPLTLEEFRHNCQYFDKEYRFIMPPMISIVPIIEESTRDNSRYSKLFSKNPDDDLILKRSKPLPRSKNTLIETMGLITKRKK